jgi:cell wall assembly regulator SMI1
MSTERWTRYTGWLAKHAPASYTSLAGPATAAQIDAVERATGVVLPEDVKAVWRINDGQKQTMIASAPSPATVCLPTLSFLSTELTIAIWREWAQVRAAHEDAGGRSLEPGIVQPLYSNAGWIPLWADPVRADYIGVDLAPGEKGCAGQIINFGRDEDEHYRCALSFGGLLDILLEEMDSGAWTAYRLRVGDGEIPWLGATNASFFNALSRRCERKPALSVGQQLSAALADARSALRDGDFARAKERIGAARALKPQHAPSEGLLVRVLVAEGRVKDADATFDALIAWAPRYPDAPQLRTLLGRR